MRERPSAALAIVGGGTRGAAPGAWLAELEHRLRRPVRKRFDLIAGTSVGAVEAAWIAAGRPAAEINPWLFKWGPEVFPQGPIRSLRRVVRLVGRPRYSPRGLERALKAAFGELRMNQLGAATMLVATDLERSEPRLFRSYKLPDADLRVRDVLMASTAAPTYLPAVEIRGRWYADGGLCANHPGPEAVAELWERFRRPFSEVSLLALGTGTPGPASGDWGSRGALEWAPDLVGAFMKGQVAARDALCRTWLGTGYRYAQFPLPARLAALDAPGDAPEIAELARKSLAQGSAGRALEAFV